MRYERHYICIARFHVGYASRGLHWLRQDDKCAFKLSSLEADFFESGTSATAGILHGPEYRAGWSCAKLVLFVTVVGSRVICKIPLLKPIWDGLGYRIRRLPPSTLWFPFL